MTLNCLKSEPDKILSILFIVWCLVLPWSVAAMQIMLGLLIVTRITTSLLQKRSPVKFHYFYIFIGLYLFFNFITLLVSPDRFNAFKGIVNTEWIILTIPFIVSLPVTARGRKYSFRVLLFSAALAGVYGIIQFFTGVDPVRNKTLGQFGNYYRSVGGYGAILSYAGNQLMAFGGAFAFFLTSSPRRINKIYYFIILTVLFLSIIASQTRSTLVALAVVLVLGFLLTHNRKFIYVMGMVLVFFVAMVLFSPGLKERLITMFNPAENYTRLNLWKSSLEIIADHPVSGIGHGVFNDYLEVYRVPGFYGAGRHAHNDLLNIALINGLPGLLSWLLIWGVWLTFAIRRYKTLNYTYDDNRIVLGTILAVTGILVAGIFQCYYTDLENNLFWWFMAALALQIDLDQKKTAMISCLRMEQEDAEFRLIGNRI
jgi:O-antigen ligase